MQSQGIIIKGIAGFYYVEIDNQRIIECKARGVFRKEKVTPVVGDKVIIEIGNASTSTNANNDKGVIIEILPRTSLLIRPVVANVNQAIIVFAITSPDINYMLLDKLLIMSEHHNIKTVICINKSDLGSNEDFGNIKECYNKIGYEVIKTNGHNSEGIALLKEHLRNKISVFVGPSGVGKSTLFNTLQSKVIMKTGKLSEKIDKGKHTTRHAELIEVEEGSFLVDTPGFSSMSIDFLEPSELQYLFKDFEDYINCCKFTSCLHDKEIDCRIKAEVEKGNISKLRYETYVGLLNELQTEFTYRRNKR